MIVAGLGFRAGADEAALAAALALLGRRPDRLAVPARKAESPALRALAGRAGLQVTAVPEEALAGVATATRSARILDLYGTGSVAEAAALVAAGPGARLLVRRLALGPVTAALAEGRTSTEGSAA